ARCDAPAAAPYSVSRLTPCSATATGAGALSVPVTPVTYTNNTNVGTANASAMYAGDANHNGSTGKPTFAADQAASVTAVNCPSAVTYDGTAQTPCSVSVTG